MNLKTRISIIGTVFVLVLTGTILIAQNDSEDKDRIAKEIKVEIIDGEKTVTIKTVENGKESIKTLTGEEADNFLEEEHELSHHSCANTGENCKKIVMNISDDMDFSELIELEELKGLSEEIIEEIESAMSNLEITINDKELIKHDKDGNKTCTNRVKIVTRDSEDENQESVDIDIKISTCKEGENGEKRVIKKVIIEDDKENEK